MTNLLPELARVRGHTIWTRNLGPSSIVVDAGAHRGEFSRRLIDAFQCRCYLVEANPELASRLNVRGAAATLPVALAAADSHSTFVIRANAEAGGIQQHCASNENGVRVETVTLATLMQRARLSRIDLLKLDIEGSEFDLIAGTPDQLFRGIGQITVEFHDFLPQFTRQGLFERARRRLEGLGFACCRMSVRTHGDVLFLNKERLGIGAWSALRLAALGPLVVRRRSL